MSTQIRPELSKNNKYYISKHRYYELKHFCLQYPEWKREYLQLVNTLNSSWGMNVETRKIPSEKINEMLHKRLYFSNKMDLVRINCKKADEDLYPWIFDAVTEEHSYEYLKMMRDIPCGKDMFYDRYHKFFWLLDRALA